MNSLLNNHPTLVELHEIARTQFGLEERDTSNLDTIAKTNAELIRAIREAWMVIKAMPLFPVVIIGLLASLGTVLIVLAYIIPPWVMAILAFTPWTLCVLGMAINPKGTERFVAKFLLVVRMTVIHIENPDA